MHYQVAFEFRDEEEGLRATETERIGIWESLYNALVESKIVSYRDRLFVWEDNYERHGGLLEVLMVETSPTPFEDTKMQTLGLSND